MSSADLSNPTSTAPADEKFEVPSVTYEEARRIMTRTDFLDPLDHSHIISIDAHHHIRIDSMLLVRAIQNVIAEKNFDDMLDQTRARVDEIEALHRQSELTVKEPFRITVHRQSSQTVLDVIGLGGSFVPAESVEREKTAEKREEERSALLPAVRMRLV